MSTETAILLAIHELSSEQAERLAAMERRLDLLARLLPDMPDRLTTREAATYARVTQRTIHNWHANGSLSMSTGRRPWSRTELDEVLAGVPVSRETRGRRRVA